MNITNVNHIVGERVVMFGVEMNFGDVIQQADTAFEFNLCDKFDHNPLFRIIVNTKVWKMYVEDVHNKNQSTEIITKKDISSIPIFIETIRSTILGLPLIVSYFNLLGEIQNQKRIGFGGITQNVSVKAGYGGASYISHSVSFSPTQSFSHLTGSLGKPINPNKPKFMSKGTAKLPVTMSVVDDELW
jgi:hypothetical protein